MKKIIGFLLLCVFVMCAALNATAAQGVIKDGRTLVPVRGVFEELGFTVEWDGAVGKATLTDENHAVSIIKGQNYIKVDGKQIYPDVPQQVIDNGLYLPVKAIADAIGADTSWNSEKKLVHISYNGKDSYISCVEIKPAAQAVTPKSTPVQQTQKATAANTNAAVKTYVLNTNTMRIHYPSCSSVGKIKPENYQEYTGTFDELTAKGYVACGNCHPH
ncbi:MAG: copper amine oxidase N-terminal domain-containing protein [Firmicutes bacterium]|nr:copper amine oxidase N-terminal domain-containing protein [Bacillota bacterium]